ncbi:origin recognition complex subunit 4 C-terminus-domain-containing protein [Irpex rosettiformis]|uniref:Origin recognition complex subunit 4 C-terminus-domain-containing protein n=1 Tax=Irpex rosettiformis TaxID=378272 RepID=A0ACB8UDY2_9APHY|nr:origin recognition complex subunit 4 C-terminus-domain-containing protein [Irpex rosettiformis]
MAIKRKAAAIDDQEPPPKRTTRSRGPLEETQPVVEVTERSRRRRTTKSSATITSDSPSEDEEAGKATRLSLRKGTRSRIKKKQPIPDPEHSTLPKQGGGRACQLRRGQSVVSEASSSKVTIEALRPTTESDDSPDELLLSSPPQSRPLTPKRSQPRAECAPRVFLDAVEIVTPSQHSLKRASLPPLSSQKTSSTPPASTALLKKDLTAVISSPRGTHSPRLPALLLPQVAEADDELNILAPEPLRSPTKNITSTLFSSSRKAKGVATPQTSPSRLRVLPSHLHASLHAQKRAALRALDNLNIPAADDDADDEFGPPTNDVAFKQLSDLLKGTVERGEGNSCLLIGPRGSGKTQIFETAISALPEEPIVIRLSGHVQNNDRLAVREIARQLADQTGKSLLPTEEDDQDNSENPFLSSSDTVISLPPPSHLLALISVIPTLSRPTIVVLDASDLFALHARQALLYCLLDTVQSCRVGSSSKGLAVVGVTTQVDTINMLEKRVKSRFSGRMLRTASPRKLDDWIRGAKAALCTSLVSPAEEDDDWSRMWESSVTAFFDNPNVLELLRETFSLSRDVRLLSRLLIQPVVNLAPSSPFLTLSALTESTKIQRCPPRLALLNSLNYPSICLLIAAIHARTSGHEAVTFEMLHESFRDQLRTSLSAPVQVEGGGIGMIRCSRQILLRTFETLIAQKLFVALAPPSLGTGKEFTKYRCVAERSDVKRAVEKMGQLSLRKWFSKAQ